MSINEMGKADLRTACKAAGIKGYGNMTNDAMRAALQPQADAVVVTVEPAPVAAPAAVEPAVAAAKPARARKAKAPKAAVALKDQRNGVTRPVAGNKCSQVWAAIDALTPAGTDITFDALREALPPVIADATVRTQRQRWKTYGG